MNCSKLRSARRGFARIALIASLAAACAVVSRPCASAQESSSESARASSGCGPKYFTVVIDVGHSASAPGAISARLVTEYSYNLKLASVVRDVLIAKGFPDTHVIVSSASDLASRPARAAALHANVFISIHHDSAQPQYLSRWTTEDGRPASYSDRFKGYSIFYSERSRQPAESLALARLLGAELRARNMTFSPHHGENIKGERRIIVDYANGIYRWDGLIVLKLASMPAILLEAGVIVNRQEELEVT